MNWIIEPRRSGKTTELIMVCAETGGYIICHGQRDAARIFEQARHMGLDIPMPLTYFEFLSKSYYGFGVKQFHIEDVDDLLRCLAGSVPIATATLSPEARIYPRKYTEMGTEARN